MSKFLNRTILILLLICSLSFSKLLRFNAEVQYKGTAESDYIEAYKMIHFSDSGAPWELSHKQELFPSAPHKGIYTLALS